MRCWMQGSMVEGGVGVRRNDLEFVVLVVIAVDDYGIVRVWKRDGFYLVKRLAVTSPLHAHTSSSKDNLVEGKFDLSQVGVSLCGEGHVGGSE